MNLKHAPSLYSYLDANEGHHHTYIKPILSSVLSKHGVRTIFDLGCGNGSLANYLSSNYQVVGVDNSETGIAEARRSYPHVRLELASVYDDLAARFGQFDAVASIEVVEHLFDPRLYARRMFSLTRPGGIAIVSTPYHGYWKNLALAITGKMDAHFTALWDGGHIKFWSVRTLTQLLLEAGFMDVSFHYVGRVPALAKSMVAVATRSRSLDPERAA